MIELVELLLSAVSVSTSVVVNVAADDAFFVTVVLARSTGFAAVPSWWLVCCHRSESDASLQVTGHAAVVAIAVVLPPPTDATHAAYAFDLAASGVEIGKARNIHILLFHVAA